MGSQWAFFFPLYKANQTTPGDIMLVHLSSGLNSSRKLSGSLEWNTVQLYKCPSFRLSRSCTFLLMPVLIAKLLGNN